jgi:hypothetical protein
LLKTQLFIRVIKNNTTKKANAQKYPGLGKDISVVEKVSRGFI